MVAVYKLQFQTQFHCYIIAHGVTCRNSSMYTVAIAYTMLFTNNVYIVFAFMHSIVLMLCVNCPIMSNSFCMNSYWGALKLDLPRAPKMLRPV